MNQLNSPYSPLKIFHHQDRLQELRDGRQPVPLQVQLVISDLCNQNCSFCAYRMSGYTSNQLFTRNAPLAAFGTNNPKRMIPYAKVSEIIEDCRQMGVRAIQLTGGGEPSVHPDFHKICRDILDAGLELAVVTNGASLKPAVIDLLARATWVRFSIDAGRAKTYAKIRSVGEDVFRRVLRSMQELHDARREQGTSVAIGAGFVLTADNYVEVEEFVQAAKAHGADNARISAVFQPEGSDYFGLFHSYASDLCQFVARKYTDDSFRVFNLFGDRLDDLRQERPEYEFCGYQHFNTYIGGDLNVYRCCGTAYNERGLLGSLASQKFSELWYGRDKADKMREFDARGCERCQFNNKNRTILYAIANNPAHVNFV